MDGYLLGINTLTIQLAIIECKKYNLFTTRFYRLNLCLTDALLQINYHNIVDIISVRKNFH